MKEKINTAMMEFNKPSELTQIIFTKENKHDSATLYEMNPMQIDLINFIYYRVRETIIKEKMVINESGMTEFYFPIQDISKAINKYKNNQYNTLIKTLNDLSDVKIILNSLGKNKDIDEMIITRFILEMKISKHKIFSDKKTIRLGLSNTLITRFIDVKKYFSKMFFKIQFSMVSKYSKLLYEILKDYEGLEVLILNYNDCLDLLNVSNGKKEKWAIINQNILKRAVQEINEKSDIFVNYEPIKEKPTKEERLQVTKIKFNIKKQSEERLHRLGLIKESITSLPFYNKSKAKLDALIKNGYKVIDEEGWIEVDIKKNEEKYDCEVRIDKWLEETTEDVKLEILQSVTGKLEDCEDHTTYIKEYRLTGIFSQEAFTKNAKETIEILNKAIIEYQHE